MLNPCRKKCTAGKVEREKEGKLQGNAEVNVKGFVVIEVVCRNSLVVYRAISSPTDEIFHHLLVDFLMVNNLVNEVFLRFVH